METVAARKKSQTAANDCPFCKIAASILPYESNGVSFRLPPLNPVTPGHVLVVSERHLEHAAVSPAITGRVMEHAAQLARELGPCNIITSIGPEATQTVRHLHIHVVPRRHGDGLALPWTAKNTK